MSEELPKDIREHLARVESALAAMARGDEPDTDPRAALEEALRMARGTAGWSTITDLPNVIRKNIVRLRTGADWSQRELGEQMQAAGFGWSRAIAGHVEMKDDSGQVYRNVSITELLGLALIFDVPLTELLVPAHGETPVELGNRSFTPDELTGLLTRTDDDEEGR